MGIFDSKIFRIGAGTVLAGMAGATAFGLHAHADADAANPAVPERLPATAPAECVGVSPARAGVISGKTADGTTWRASIRGATTDVMQGRALSATETAKVCGVIAEATSETKGQKPTFQQALANAEARRVLATQDARDPALNATQATATSSFLNAAFKNDVAGDNEDNLNLTIPAMVHAQATLIGPVRGLASSNAAADVKVIQQSPKDPLAQDVLKLKIESAPAHNARLAALQGAKDTLQTTWDGGLTRLTAITNPSWVVDHAFGQPTEAMRTATASELRGGDTMADTMLKNERAYLADPAAAAKHAVPAYSDPVIGGDTPDPSVLRVGGEFIETNTGGNLAGVFPLRSSTDLVHWKDVGAIFKTPPAWTSGDDWAPEIHHVGDSYVAYYTARAANTGKLAIGVATSKSPTGPYTDLGPLVQKDGMGVIDATFFHDDKTGANYLFGKDDTNDPSTAGGARPTTIWMHALDATGTKLGAGGYQPLLTANQPWQGGILEAPEIVQHNGEYFMFNSGGGYDGAGYTIGIARAKSLNGPWVERAQPLYSTNGDIAGPGHDSDPVLGPDLKEYLPFHAFSSSHVGYENGGQRSFDLRQLNWGADGWPKVG